MSFRVDISMRVYHADQVSALRSIEKLLRVLQGEVSHDLLRIKFTPDREKKAS